MLQTLADFGIRSVDSVRSAHLFLIALPDSQIDQGDHAQRIADQLLTDSLVEICTIHREGEALPQATGALPVEVYFKPGVMDNVARSTAIALADMGIKAANVRTGRQFELRPIPDDRDITRISRLLANDCIEDVFVGTRPIEPPPEPPQHRFEHRRVPIRDMNAEALQKLSRAGHLFLSREEMEAIQRHFERAGRDPTDLEIETFAQTWSEHCVHKTLKSAIEYRGAPFPTANGSARETPAGGQSEVTLGFDNLLQDTIVRATKELTAEGRGPECLSVFVDNAGVIGLDEVYGIAFKVETHNHPSAIEPYGGAATGVGGVIRDILGCGLGAKPIANTDVFCVAPPTWPVDRVPKGVIHPKAVLRGVVAGVRDYGNRMGIPTVNGAVHFDPRYLGNPLVFCGCVGLIPRNRIEKGPRPGDAIVLIGGRTGRDGIHGATFSSAELTESHEEEFAHAVQIGNPVEEKKLLDIILQARDYAVGDDGRTRCLFSCMTDCGAGGLSSAIGEIASPGGAEVHLERVPLKYAGLRCDEIWISEAQERMVLALPPSDVEPFLRLAAGEDVEATVIGRFTDTGRLVVKYDGTVVGDLDMAFLHEGRPRTALRAEWHPPVQPGATPGPPVGRELCSELKRRLRDPTVASKHWIIRQYDHEVQGGSVVKPLVGPGEGPADAAVIRPRLDRDQGLAIGCGLAPRIGDLDPYWMAVAAIDEAVRNVVCVGGDPRRTALLDNFCWPDCDDPHALGALVRACRACYDVAKAYGIPFISGKDSLNNVFSLGEGDVETVRDVLAEHFPAMLPHFDDERKRHPKKISIPYTLLISAVSLVDEVHRCICSVPRLVGDQEDAAPLYYVGTGSARWRDVNLSALARLHRGVADLIQTGRVLAAHDVSDGGVAVAVAEMAFGGFFRTTCAVYEDGLLDDPSVQPPSAYLLQLRDTADLAPFSRIPGVIVGRIATFLPAEDEESFTFVRSAREPRSSETGPRFELEARRAWREPLDW